ncbi:hypothetical protein L227DRAFT_574710 [Lentinus tigrinus ALCF2SS1-6]|uniref:Secreted protein n=1 Tax=Lentinus tigrinus ALCF2SS1-6 TaxID=1328759 RepID=A0A5C2SD79_9APHY|nr:hypothetical protein L227DRAFT_574710 [Lentinus tigrinus ALCF2SS1-6]
MLCQIRPRRFSLLLLRTAVKWAHAEVVCHFAQSSAAPGTMAHRCSPVESASPMTTESSSCGYLSALVLLSMANVTATVECRHGRQPTQLRALRPKAMSTFTVRLGIGSLHAYSCRIVLLDIAVSSVGTTGILPDIETSELSYQPVLLC